MHVPVTLIGVIVGDPQLTRTKRNVPVAKFRMSTSRKAYEDGQPMDVDVTTWAVTAFDKLAEHAMRVAAVGQFVIAYGQVAESRWERHGQQRREFEVRADAIAPNAGNAIEPARLTLVGTVVGKPEIEFDDGVPYVDMVVRTSRWRNIGRDERTPVDITDWPVVASGATAQTIADQFDDGDDVVVYGEARGIERDRADGSGAYQDLEVWVEAIGPDLKRSLGRPA